MERFRQKKENNSTEKWTWKMENFRTNWSRSKENRRREIIIIRLAKEYWFEVKVNFLVMNRWIRSFYKACNFIYKGRWEEGNNTHDHDKWKLQSVEHFTREITEDAGVKTLWRITILTKFFNKFAMERKIFWKYNVDEHY